MAHRFLVVLYFLAVGRSLLAGPGSIDPSLGQGLEYADDWVRCLAVRPDGHILIGGPFTFYKGVAVKGMVEIHPDGTLARTFSHPFVVPSYQYPIRFCIQPDGKVLVLGDYHLFRLNDDGTRDTSFVPPPSNGDAKSDLLLQPDGKVLVAGYSSTNAADPYRKGITRLNSDGSVDTGFNAPNPTSQPWKAQAVAGQPDGKIIVAGFQFEGVPADNTVHRLHANGAHDPTFVWGAGRNGGINAMHVLADGKILVAGEFNYIESNTERRRYLIRLNPY